jgi:D-3-phosphoglycerate dehydrogenase
MTLTERMGRFLGLWVYGKPVEEISIIYRGVFSDADRPLVTLGLIKGFLSPSFAEKVNFVNARSLAQQAEIRVLESSGQASPHFTCLVEARVKAKDQEPVVLSGALFGNVDYRFVEFEGFRLDGHPTGWVLITINQDIPNMVGQIGSLLGKHGVNIASMHLGRRDRDRLACAMTNVDSEVPAKVLEELRSISGVTFAKQFHIPGTSS